MNLRIATFNMENLFTRPAAMADDVGPAGTAAIAHHAELNGTVEKPSYSAADKARLIALDLIYGFSRLNPPSNALIKLDKIRGRLFSTSQQGVVTVVANGRGDWTGWFSLLANNVAWAATYNTGRVIAEVDADILVCIEVENRPTVKRFNKQVLGAEFDKSYPHIMVIDGNDDRGIDVGLLSKFPILAVKSHVDDLNPNGEFTFSRDCPEYLVELPGGHAVVILPNHFKSKRGGNNPAAQTKRRLQAEGAARIARHAAASTPMVMVAGDLNDTPNSPMLAALFADGYVDVQSHVTYPTDRPGTFGTGTAANKIDYLIMSPALEAKLVGAGIERRGSFHPQSWVPFDTVHSAADEASDHHLVWADFTL